MIVERREWIDDLREWIDDLRAGRARWRRIRRLWDALLQTLVDLAQAYGWGEDYAAGLLNDEEVLTRLVAPTAPAPPKKPRG